MSSDLREVVYIDEDGALHISYEASRSTSLMPRGEVADHRRPQRRPNVRLVTGPWDESARLSPSSRVDAFISIDRRGSEILYERLRLPEANRSHHGRGPSLAGNRDTRRPPQDPGRHNNALVTLGPNPARQPTSNPRIDFALARTQARAESEPHSGTSERSNFNGWILHATGDRHKCNDDQLFRHIIIPNPRRLEEGTPPEPYGTVVLPILPGIRHPFPYLPSVMTLSNVSFTPGAGYSEMSWPLLRAQGFTITRITDDLHEIVTDLPRAFTRNTVYAIWHRALPGVHWFYANEIPGSRDRLGILSLRCNMEVWREGIVNGVLGKSVEMQGPFAWTEQRESGAFVRTLWDARYRGEEVGKYFGWVDGRVEFMPTRYWDGD